MTELKVKKTMQGKVVSVASAKTAVVEVERTFTHPRYRKVMRRHKKYMIHDENNNCRMGDVVNVVSTRPLSKLKRWRYVETVRHFEALPEVAAEHLQVAEVEKIIPKNQIPVQPEPEAEATGEGETE